MTPPRPPAGLPPAPSPPGGGRRLAPVSLVLGIVGFLLGTYDIAFQSRDVDSYTGGADPLSYRIMWFVVLPCGVLGILLATIALASLAVDEAPGRRDADRDTARAIAWSGLALSALVTVLALVGAFLIFLELAGPD